MNGWARLPKTHKTCEYMYKHTDTEPDCAEIGSAGRPMLLVSWNCVAGTTAMMSVMDYSGKLAKKALCYLWKK